jgi:hypothetical protein
MTERGYTESAVEYAEMTWTGGVGWHGQHRAEIVPGELGAEHTDYVQLILVQRLGDAPERLNPQLATDVFDDTFQNPRHAERLMLEAYKRPMHQGMFLT